MAGRWGGEKEDRQRKGGKLSIRGNVQGVGGKKRKKIAQHINWRGFSARGRKRGRKKGGKGKW